MTQPTLRPGQIGAGVKALQDLLNDELALDPPLTVDGHYGPLTLEAVYAFQASAVGPDGSPLTIDGIVGPLTWWALTTADQTKAFRLQGPVRVGEARCALGARTVERAIEEMRSRTPTRASRRR